jgi:hypothetical protein
MAWENKNTEEMIVNPITRLGLEELGQLGAEELWTVLHVPADLTVAIQFREIDFDQLIATYRRMEKWATPGLCPSRLTAVLDECQASKFTLLGVQNGCLNECCAMSCLGQTLYKH